MKKIISVDRLYLLLVSGLPGLSKVLFSFLIKGYGGLEYVGEYANDLSVVSIIGTITVLGFTSVIMNRLPVLDKEEVKVVFAKIVLLSLSLNFLSVGLLYVLFYTGIVINLTSSVAYLLGYSFSQLYRSKLIARANYRNILILDFLVIIVFIFLLLLKVPTPLVYLGITLFIIYGITLSFSIKIDRRIFSFLNELKSGLWYGASNLSSGILSLMSVPLANQLLGVIYAGVLGVINPIINFALLIPRSLGAYYIPKLVKLDMYGVSQYKMFKMFFNRIVGFLLIVCLGIVGIYGLFVFYKLNNDFIIGGSFVIVTVIVVNVFVSQIALPYYSLLNAWDKSFASFVSNLLVLLLFTIGYGLIFFTNVNLDSISVFILLYVILIILNIGRLWGLRIIIHRSVKRTDL